MATLSRGMRLSLMLIPAFCCPAETPAQQPAWRLDLSNYPKQQIETRAFTNPLPRNTGVAFLDDRTVVAYFIGRASPPSLSVRGERSQFFFRAVFLDSSGGTERSKQDWPADLLSSSFLPAQQGTFIVRFGSTLRLYSRDFKSIAEITLPEKEKHEIQRLAISPSGRVLWFIRHRYTPKSFSTIQRYDARSLAPVSKPEEDDFLKLDFSVSDESMADSYPQIKIRVRIRDPQGDWRSLLERRKDQGCVGEPTFAGNDLLVVAGCRHIILVTPKGEVLLDEDIKGPWHVESQPAVSRDGRFAAISLMKTKGGAFDTPVRRAETRIVVYDLAEKRRVREIPVSPTPRSSYSFAVSPDGSALAVMTDWIIKLYTLAQ